jgi:PelA/Pel-15E family pectate lyase
MLRPRPLLAFSLSLTLTLSAAFAAPVTPDRLKDLPAAEQTAWQTYLERSAASALADTAAVQAEVAAHGLPAALIAPSGGNFKLPAAPTDAWYAGEEAGHLADSILSFQTPAGGWSKHTGYSHGPRKPGMQWTSQNEPGQSAHYVATFDNHATTEELTFLANVWRTTKREDCKAAVVRGLDFILAAQYPNGGWPQVYPIEGGYHDDITFNDDAMTHVLEFLRDAATGTPEFALLDETQRHRAADALAAGIRCVVQMQVPKGDQKTVWCAQHDALTLLPAAARKMEPATLSGLESAHVVEFLMSLLHPAPEIVASIESGLAWLEHAKITGLAKTKVAGKAAYVTDPASTEVFWARFYNLESGKPVFPGRDGVVYETFEAMSANNRLGYDFYTTLPNSIVANGQKKWRKMLEKDRPSSK